MIKKIDKQNKKFKLKFIHKLILFLILLLGAVYGLDYFFDRYTLQSPIIIKFQSPIKQRVIEDARLGKSPALRLGTPSPTPARVGDVKKAGRETVKNNYPIEAIRKVFGNNKMALAIAIAESRLNCKAVSKTDDYGLFQINKIHLWRFEKRGLDPFNCYHNALVAFEIFQERGWQAWSAFKNGSYRKFLSYKFD